MTSYNRRAWAGTIFLTACTALSIQAKAITFINIVDDTSSTPVGGTFTFLDAPSISGNTVVFDANYTGGMGSQGIFKGSGGALTTIATGGTGAPTSAPGGGTFIDFTNPSINGGTVTFGGSYTGGTGNQGIFTRSGGGLTTVVTGGTGAPTSAPGGGTFTNFGSPGISGSTVVFGGNYTGGVGNTGIFSKNGASLTTVITGGTGAPAVAPGGGTFNSFGTSPTPSISGSTVAFGGSYTGGTGSQGIFTKNGAVLTTIVTGGTGAPSSVPGGGTFSSFGSSPIPSISGNTIAFFGRYTGGTGGQGIFTGTGGSLTMIATNGTGSNATPGGGTFTNFNGSPTISGDTVAFWADYTGGTGVFISKLGILSSVIKGGDSLFGSTVASLSLGQASLDGNNLAFSYSLNDGRSGIAVANLIDNAAAPEPGSFVFLGLGIIPVAGMIRRRPLR